MLPKPPQDRRSLLETALGLGFILVASIPSIHAANDTWDGSTDATWATGTNWALDPAVAPGTGNTATFNNAGGTDDVINLGSGVTVSTILFDTANAAAYTIGSGPVGSQSLTFNLGGGITMNSTVTANQRVNANLILGTDNTGSANTVAGSVNFTNHSTTNSLTLAGAINPWQLNGNYKHIYLDGAGAINLTGAINNNIWIDKNGTGTSTLSGGGNFLGSIAVHNGTLAWSGTNTAAVSGSSGAWLVVGDTANTKARLDITGGSLTRYDIGIGSNATATGAVYQSGGNLTITRAAGTLDFRLGDATNGFGYYRLSGSTSTFATNEAGIGLGSNATGVMDVSGGTFTSNGWITLGRGTGTSSGLLNITGGLVEFSKTAGAADSNNSRLGLQWGNSAGAQSVVNIANGSLVGDDYIDLAVTNTTGTMGAINLLAGGVLQGSRVTASAANPTALLNFNGGTLKANGVNGGVNFLNSANIDAVTVFSGGGTIDNNGTNITIGRPLLAATGNGVTTIAVADGGSGYLGAPLVRITGGTGNGATAYANMVDDGSGNGTFKIGSITITSPGTYTVDPTGITLTGGGATAAASGFTIATQANTSGGMTFSGAGGTTGTTLAGANTYTGATQIDGKVTVGVASVADVSGALGNNSAVTLANSANASLGLNNFDTRIGSLAGGGTTGGNVTLGAATLTTGGSNKSGSYAGAISGSGGLTKVGTGTQTLTGTNTYNGSTLVNGGTLVVGVGGTGSITSSVAVAGGATLGGSGTIAGNITLAAESSIGAKDGGILAAGNSPGVLTATGTTTLNSGSIFSWELASNVDGDATDGGDTGSRGTDYDGLTSGALSVASGAVFRVILSDTADLGDSFWTQSQRWTDIFNVSGTTTGASLGSLFDSFEVYDGSTNITLSSASYGGFGFDGTTLTWSAVPEPGAAMAGLLVAAGLLRRRRGS